MYWISLELQVGDSTFGAHSEQLARAEREHRHMETCDDQKTSCVICHDGYNDLVPQEKHYRVHRLLLPCGAQCPLILSGTHMINCYDTRLSAGFVTSTQCVIQPLCPWNAVLRSPRSVACAFQIGPESWLAIHAVQHEIQHNF